jgi:hypothetical protein
MKFQLSPVALLVGAFVAAPIAVQAQQAATASAAFASSPGKAMMAETVKAQAVISALDTANRILTLKAADGKAFDMIAGPEIKNFAQLKVGDKVNVQYARALSLELKKAGAPTAANSATAGATSAAPGAKPGGMAGAQVTVVADVTAVDAKTQLVTLKGPKGNVVDLKVKDPKQFAMIKVGDKVEAVYTEALAVSVEAAK